MTLPASGPLVLGSDGGASGRSINSEFGYGNDMASYQGVFYGKNGLEYQFPPPGNSIAMNQFYSTYKITGGGPIELGAGTFVIPVYNLFSVTVIGGGGGGSGQYGYISSPCPGAGSPTPSDNGSAGGASSFGGYITASGGAGGSGNAVAGQSGQSITITYTNPVQGGNGPPSGAVVAVSVGAGGVGGQGGCNIYSVSGTCACWGRYASGANGSAGHVYVSWA